MCRYTLRIISLFILFAVSVCDVAFAQDNKLQIKTVVIDPGHGGGDSGCVSRDGKTKEKTLTLTMSQLIGSRIKAAYPDIKVIYTRTTDKAVTLKDRAEIANRNKADLFLSVHINSFTNTSPSGSSSHVLGASRDKNRDIFSDNMELCQRENSVILLEEDYSTSYQGFNPNDPESYIIFNLLQNAHLTHSLEFASMIQDEMGRGPITKNRGVSQDPFYVLYRTTMPSVLVELGFISNAADLAVLRSKSGQNKIADNVFRAFEKYKKMYEGTLSSGKVIEEPKDVKKESVSAPGPDVDTDAVEAPAGGVTYGVQIFALSRQLKSGDRAFKGVDCRCIDAGKLYKYVAGSCRTEAEARALLKKVSQKFPDAYLVRVEGSKVSPVK